MNHLEQLNWRYATKRMTGEKISEASLNNILKAVELAPTSLGLQPFKVLVIESDEAKEKLSKACAQPQIKESSSVLVFCAWDKHQSSKVEDYIQNIATTRGVELSSLDEFKNMINGFISNLDEEKFVKWAANQAYIALGFGLYAAALEQVDATPMEGFSPEALDEVFELKNQGLKSVVLLALGKRNEEVDYLAKVKKVRRSQDFFEKM